MRRRCALVSVRGSRFSPQRFSRLFPFLTGRGQFSFLLLTEARHRFRERNAPASIYPSPVPPPSRLFIGCFSGPRCKRRGQLVTPSSFFSTPNLVHRKVSGLVQTGLFRLGLSAFARITAETLPKNGLFSFMTAPQWHLRLGRPLPGFPGLPVLQPKSPPDPESLPFFRLLVCAAT